MSLLQLPKLLIVVGRVISKVHRSRWVVPAVSVSFREQFMWSAAGNISQFASASISLGVYDTTAPTAVSVEFAECSYYIKDPGLLTAYWETSSNPAALSAGTYTLAGDLNAALADETTAEIESYPLLSIPTGVSVTAAESTRCQCILPWMWRPSQLQAHLSRWRLATDDQAVTITCQWVCRNSSSFW